MLQAKLSVRLFPMRLNVLAKRNVPTKTFHKRPLPSTLTSLSSSLGKQYFREALSEGGMECFFPLSEQFVTQSEPSYCSISSLAMVLNALNHDPKKVWKGAWRWVSEETLQCETMEICGHSLNRIKTSGLSFSEFESLANCHSVRMKSFPAASDSIESFRNIIKESAYSERASMFVIVNFSRKVLGQTGDGHFSPIGGYHKDKDMVLIMDVARFKYPPFWVDLPTLWESMKVLDKQTGECRGYFTVSATSNSIESDPSGSSTNNDSNNHGSDVNSHRHCHHQHHQHHQQDQCHCSPSCSHSSAPISASRPSLE